MKKYKITIDTGNFIQMEADNEGELELKIGSGHYSITTSRDTKRITPDNVVKIEEIEDEQTT